MNRISVIRRCSVIMVASLAMAFSILAKCEEFGGFGLKVAQIFDSSTQDHMGGIVILHVPRDGEVWRAGVRAGDIIRAVDGKNTAGRKFEDVVVNTLRGEVGSIAALTIERASDGEVYTVSVKRVPIHSGAADIDRR